MILPKATNEQLKEISLKPELATMVDIMQMAEELIEYRKPRQLSQQELSDLYSFNPLAYLNPK